MGITIEVHEEDAKNGVQAKKPAKKLCRRLHQQVEGMERGMDIADKANKYERAGKRCEVDGCYFITTFTPSKSNFLWLAQRVELEDHMMTVHHQQLYPQPCQEQ